MICYHGTSKENARSILKQGFRPETWFAHHLEDAIGLGGQHVFAVKFDPDRFNNTESDTWQFFLNEWVKLDKIVSYKIYHVKQVL